MIGPWFLISSEGFHVKNPVFIVSFSHSILIYFLGVLKHLHVFCIYKLLGEC